MMKIARYIQQAGLASRREAEAWVRAGRVRVEGQIVRTPALVVKAGEAILLDDRPLPTAQRRQLWLYHKPAGLIVTRRDPQNRPTIFSKLPQPYQNLIAVGRLDLASEGLLLLTNDGALARQLELPANGVARHYRARVFGAMTQERLDRLAAGIVVNKIRYAPVKAQLEKTKMAKTSGRNQWIKITLHEGKNREVRILMESLGLQVNRLIRTGFGVFRLGRLPSGAVAPVRDALLRAQQKEWENS